MRNKAQRAAYMHKYYMEHKERARELARAWKAAHSEKVKEKRRDTWAANPEKFRAYQREYQKAHRLHINAQSTARRKANLEKRRAYERAWREAHPKKDNAGHLRRKWGLSLEDYRAMLDVQQGQCAICRVDFAAETKRSTQGRTRSCVDHDHRTGKIRALLCDWCNRGMGLFYDNPQLLRSAADYIERHRISLVPEKEA